MRMLRVALIAAATLAAADVAAAEPAAKEYFGAVPGPSAEAPQVFGGYAKGCLAGALALAFNGPELRWQAMRPARKRNFGHPELLAFVQRLSATAQTIGWGSLLVGDMAQARGGPMLTGHRSHQTGIDVDIWMRPGVGRALTAKERNTISSVSVLGADKKSVNKNWTPLHELLLFHAATDPAVARIFVHAAIKKHLCTRLREQGAPTDWLRRVRPWFGHHYHFHVRLHCPAGSPNCVAQAEPAAGDGCGEDVDRWFRPPPKPKPGAKPAKPRPQLKLGDLPPACRALVSK